MTLCFRQEGWLSDQVRRVCRAAADKAHRLSNFEFAALFSWQLSTLKHFSILKFETIEGGDTLRHSKFVLQEIQTLIMVQVEFGCAQSHE